MKEITKINTENPLLDEIVYNCTIMTYGIVLKDEKESLDNETMESLKKSDLYMICNEEKTRFIDFDYDLKFLKTCSFIPSYRLIEYAEDNSKIPSIYHNELIKRKNASTIKEYIEINDYYRKLNGLPIYGTQGFRLYELNLSLLPKDFVIDTNKYLHECTDSEIESLENAGIIEILKMQYPELKYLNYLGQNKIEIYRARKAVKFGILRVPTPPSNEVYSRYVTFLENNIEYITKTVYSEAYKFMSDYYDNFMMIMIIVQTFIDCVSEMPEYMIRRDIFDIRTTKYIFESNGIKYFDDIPLKYQIRMVRNLNKLIKFKSSTLGLIDICSMFGFDNIEIFKYYILRDRRLTSDNKYVFLKTTDPETGQLIEDAESNYNLKFLKVPIDGIADDFIKVNTNVLEYDDITLSDINWDGPYSHEYVKRKILQRDFNIELSKYISIDTVYELTEMSFDMPYFINMIMFNDISKDKLMISIPMLSESIKFNIVDLFIYLYALMYAYMGVDDLICGTITKILSIKGFNFQADLQDLYNWLLARGETLKSLGVDNFEIPVNGILSFSQLLNVFVNNKNVFKVVKAGMLKANNKKEYDIYKKIHDSFFITDLSWKYYNIPEDKILREKYTYTEFLKSKDSTLYDSIIKLKEITNKELRENKIGEAIGAIVGIIQDVLDTDLLDTIFSNLPTVSLDYVKLYLFKIINFYKSFKIRLLEINTIYKFDDNLENKIQIIDGMENLIVTHEYNQTIRFTENTIHNSVFEKSEFIEIREKIYKFIEHNSQSGYNDDAFVRDVNIYMLAIINKIDHVIILDSSEITASMQYNDWVPYFEKIHALLVTLAYKEKIALEEMFDIVRYFKRYKLDFCNIDDSCISLIVFEKEDQAILTEAIKNINREYTKDYRYIIYDKIFNNIINLKYIQHIELIEDYYISRTYQ